MTGSSPAALWRGVLVALTTPFDRDLAIDTTALRAHATWLVDRGVQGVVAGGSLGEGATLSVEERLLLVRELVSALEGRAPVVAAIASSRTSDAVALARAAAQEGAAGLLVLPPYVYRTDPRETLSHFHAVLGATSVPCMLYNNPSAYGTDVLPEQILELAEEHSLLTGVKESSGDVRRITGIRSLLGDRLEVAVGLDDAVLEGIRAGAVGWVAGLANAFPDASVELFRRARTASEESAFELYRWFLPLLRMDTTNKFVQQIKFVQSEVGRGSARVRPPRLELASDEVIVARATLRDALAHPPAGVPLE
ncbi:MAG: dihydrodipicolinate synthase family protein [Thermoplasmata archaeon]|nr:dihydrodipicolinate synthase family protein [Thermoplasmata archaeon]